MGVKSFIKEAIEEEKNKTPEQRQKEKEEKENKKLEKIYEKYSDYLLDDEKIIFNTSKHLFLDKRILFHDNRLKKGVKEEYHTIPYKNIKRFTIENAGVMDTDVDIKLFLGGGQEESITLKVPIKSTKTINEIILSKIL